jgi:hypothetical protein
MTASQWQLVFKNWHCVIREDGTLAPKHAGNAHLKFVLIKTVHFVDIISGVR